MGRAIASVVKSALSGRLSSRLSGIGPKTLRFCIKRVIKRFWKLSGLVSGLSGQNYVDFIIFLIFQIFFIII